MEAVRFFNTEGPVRADDHYCIPPLERIDLDAVLDLVRSKKYFVLHAPRQTGKTSALLALRDLQNGGAAGDFRCVLPAQRDPLRRARRSKSLRLGDFTEAETRALLAQHNEETGQAFTAEAQVPIRTRTAGQPWLVNAVCQEACFKSEAGRDRSRAIAADDVLDAQERLILARVTHLDDLADKLREERVRRVVAPMLTGADDRGSYADRDRDVGVRARLGLLAQHDAKRIANPIYADVIRRELTWVAQDDVEAEAAWYMGLRRRSGRERTAGGVPAVLPHGGRTRRFVVECKVRRDGLERTVLEGVEQTRGYMERCGAESGHLIVFDRSEARTWEEKIFRRDAPAAGGGAPVTVWGM